MENRKQTIIDKLFENRFNLDNFKDFTSQILNVKLRNRKESESIYTAFLSYINSYHIIGDYEDSDGNKVMIMTTKIKEDKDPVRARVKQREFVAKLLRDWHKDGALVVFYNENSKNWRMSFVRLSYEFTIKGIEEKITPAKRLSYVVGEDEACKTAKDQFLTLQDLKDSVTLDQLEEIFALEKVTNDFFKEYKNKYLDIKELLVNDKVFMNEAKKHDSEKPESFAEGFAKKLMGQIAFLYFLQKKGWLGIKIAPDNLDYEQFNRFYNRALPEEKAILETVYDRVDKNLYELNYENLAKIDNITESELLARPFINTEYFGDWGTGDKKFIRNLFELHKKRDAGNDKTFFDDYLEVLFYHNLSKERGEIQYSSDFNCRIPFLNGGLFDPYGDYDWEHTNFNLNDEVFSNKDNTGILDIFDIYNFTINENDSYETEIAVDPEMLGKVFENLLEVSDRKSKGAFYTPREIVRYMTNESIMNYLLTNLEGKDITKEDLEYLFNLGEFTKEYDQQIFEKDYIADKKPLTRNIFGMPRNIIVHAEYIDRLLADVKIVDPACGSGAFPLGLLNEIVRARNILTYYINLTEILTEKDEKNYWKRIDKKERERSLYTLKLYSIQNSLHGVDIEPSAIDITKLRLWLSILVDSNNDNVKPLPNLDFNFMIGNSLVDEFEGIKLFDESLLNDDILEKELGKGKLGKQKALLGEETIKQDILEDIFSKQAKFFSEKNADRKKKLKEEIEELETSLIRFTLTSSGQLDKLKEIEKGRKERRKPYFLWKLEFAKVFKENSGFDIVIGNPPYVGDKGNKDIFRPIKKTSFGKKYYKGQMDLFYFFFHLGIELTKEKGIISFITTNYYLTALGAIKLRTHIKKECNLLKLINFNEMKVFETALGQHNIITILEKNSQKNKKCETVMVNINTSVNNGLLKNILYKKSKKIEVNMLKQNDLYEGENLYIRLQGISGNEFSGIYIKMLNDSKLLKDIALINAGIGITVAKITRKYIKNFPTLNLKLNSGIFVINSKEAKNLEEEKIKDFVKNSDINHYTYKLNKDKLIYLTRNDNIDDYPNLKKHMLKYKEILVDQVIKYEEEFPWYALNRPRTREIFESKEKIIVPYRTKKNYFAYVDIPLYGGRDVLYIRSIENSGILLKYILGLLNSKLYYFWLYTKGKRKGNILEIVAQPLSEIPIKIATEEQQNNIIAIVDRIIELKKQDKDTKELEDKIDEMVYDLYELTEDEKELIRAF